MARIWVVAAVVMACLLVLSGSCLAGVEVVCDGTLQAWRSDPRMRQYLKDYSCNCSNGNSRQPVCTKRSGSGSSQSPSHSTGSRSSKNSQSNQIAKMLVAGFLQRMMEELMRPPEKTPQPARNLEEEKREAESQKQIKNQIAVMEKDYKRMQEEAAGKAKKRLLSDLKVPGGASGEGGTSKPMHQLYAANCSSYWDLMAAKSMIAGRDDEAETYRQYSARARAGDLSNCSAAMAKIPDVPSPDMTDDFRDELYADLDKEIATRTTLIPEVREKKQKAEAGVQEKEKQVEALKATIASSATEEEKKGNDDLLQKALAELESSKQLRDEAQSQYARLEKEIGALSEVHSAMTGKTKTGE